MSFYEPQGWQAPVRQPSWEQPPPPSRSGMLIMSSLSALNHVLTYIQVQVVPHKETKTMRLLLNSTVRRKPHNPWRGILTIKKRSTRLLITLSKVASFIPQDREGIQLLCRMACTVRNLQRKNVDIPNLFTRAERSLRTAFCKQRCV